MRGGNRSILRALFTFRPPVHVSSELFFSEISGNAVRKSAASHLSNLRNAWLSGSAPFFDSAGLWLAVYARQTALADWRTARSGCRMRLAEPKVIKVVRAAFDHRGRPLSQTRKPSSQRLAEREIDAAAARGGMFAVLERVDAVVCPSRGSAPNSHVACAVRRVVERVRAIHLGRLTKGIPRI